MRQARTYRKGDHLMNAYASARERLALSSHRFLFYPWLFLLLRGTSAEFNLFFLSVLCVWSKHSTLLVSMPLHISSGSLHPLVPTGWRERKPCLLSLRALRFKSRCVVVLTLQRLMSIYLSPSWSTQPSSRCTRQETAKGKGRRQSVFCVTCRQ